MPAIGPPVSPADKTRDRRLLAFIFLAATLPYLGTLQAGFTNWDDPGYVTENPSIRGFSRAHVAAWISKSCLGNRAPVHLASYALDYEVWGLRPLGFHLTNVLLQGLVAILLWRFLRHLGLRRGVTTAGVLLFALHPACVEVVAWVAERKTLLAACFMLGSALCYVRMEAGRGGAWGVPAVLLFALGLLSKVAIAPFPILLLALHRCTPLRATRGRAIVMGLFLLISIGVGLLAVQTQTAAGSAGRPLGGTLPAHAAAIAVAFRHYVLKLFLPVRLSPYYDLRHADVTISSVSLGGLGLCLSLAASLALLARRRIGGFLATAALLLWLPSSGAVVPIVAPMTDRYLYLPLLFLGPLAAMLLDQGVRGRRRWELRVAALGVCLFFGVLTIAQTAHWRSSRSLWARAVAVEPRNPYVRQKLAYTLWAAGDAAAALPHAEMAAALEPHWLEGLETLGRVALDAGRPAVAEGAFRQQLGLHSKTVNAYVGLARARRAQGDDRGAFLAYLEALQLKQNLKEAALELEAVAIGNGWEEEALDRMPRRPTSAWLDLVRGDLLARLGRRREAEALWRRVLVTRPGFPPARERLGRMDAGRKAPAAAPKGEKRGLTETLPAE